MFPVPNKSKGQKPTYWNIPKTFFTPRLKYVSFIFFVGKSIDIDI